MEPGDVLFFNGQVIHGSLPNRSRTRFRRGADRPLHRRRRPWQVARYYFPVLDMDGHEVALGGGRRRRPVRGSGWTATAARSGTATGHRLQPRRNGAWSSDQP